MRFIDADKLIMHLSDYTLTESPTGFGDEENGIVSAAYQTIKNSIKAVEEQPTVVKEGWISAKDRLPEDVQEVLSHMKAIVEILKKYGKE